MVNRLHILEFVYYSEQKIGERDRGNWTMTGMGNSQTFPIDITSINGDTANWPKKNKNKTVVVSPWLCHDSHFAHSTTTPQIMCSFEVSPVNITNTIRIFNESLNDIPTVTYNNPIVGDGIFDSSVCLLFPSYFSNFAVLLLVATSLIAQLSHICKIILMCLISGKL